ncbi:hypothetical protein EH165_04570 [Nakamurella antarctica]|uniref:Uncharacterized protein n=1 Tax=Nakamurella antarctica TaxID=1902245 RepID=A0A3G8ZJK5_9ACTN|nr:hypothetical protein [Nakamurella antarctica]AZI57542.1 hypothetical protein EH165_04570 [Nakamurella antarctica]
MINEKNKDAVIPVISLVRFVLLMSLFVAVLLCFTFQPPFYVWLIPIAILIPLVGLVAIWYRDRPTGPRP